MVSLQTIQQSNSSVATLPQGLVALFVGATSGIGKAALQQLAQSAAAPRIYTVARPPSVATYERMLASLRQANPAGTYNLITADVALVSEVDKIVKAIVQKESKVDVIFMSTGFMAFEGRKDTIEALEPSMTTRYYSRLRLVEQLLPLLNNTAAASPRVVSVQAGGLESPLNEVDLDLREPHNWSFWSASRQATTMGTLALEHIARENPRLSIVHWFPGPVSTPGLTRAAGFGISPQNPTSETEAGARGLFLATSDRYSVHGSLVPPLPGLTAAKTSGGGIFLVDPACETTNNEAVLANMRERKVDELVWHFTQKTFASCLAQAGRDRDDL